MKIALFGANGGTGRVLTAQALAAGHEVTAVTRHPETFGLAHERLRVVAGDAMDAAPSRPRSPARTRCSRPSACRSARIPISDLLGRHRATSSPA